MIQYVFFQIFCQHEAFLFFVSSYVVTKVTRYAMILNVLTALNIPCWFTFHSFATDNGMPTVMLLNCKYLWISCQWWVLLNWMNRFTFRDILMVLVPSFSWFFFIVKRQKRNEIVCSKWKKCWFPLLIENLPS